MFLRLEAHVRAAELVVLRVGMQIPGGLLFLPTLGLDDARFGRTAFRFLGLNCNFGFCRAFALRAVAGALIRGREWFGGFVFRLLDLNYDFRFLRAFALGTDAGGDRWDRGAWSPG